MSRFTEAGMASSERIRMNADQQLDEATIRQLTWKPAVSTMIAGRIVNAFLARMTMFADEIDLTDIGDDDANCIGLVWRRLARAGILKQTDTHRRSVKPRSKGRVVWAYTLISRKRAETFLKRNDVEVTGRPLQLDLI